MTSTTQITVISNKKEIHDRRILGPKMHLVLFCWCQAVVYFDRGLVSGMLDSITEEVEGAQSKFLAGFLGGMFMIGYMVASPLFVRLSQRSRVWTLYSIMIGLTILTLSAIATYFVWQSFAALLLVRLVSGAGEAGFVSLAPPIIDASAPVGKKSLYVGLYFTFLYVGYGLGSGACFLFTSWRSGRVLFLIEAAMVVPCIVVFGILRDRFSIPDSIKEDTVASSEGGSLMSQLKVVLGRPLFTLLSIGYGAFFFSFGAFAYWTPTVMKNLYPEEKSIADLGFGAVTVLTGIVGTAMGGFLMDHLCLRLSKRNGLQLYSEDLIRVMGGAMISCVLVLSGMLFTFPAVFSPNIFIFLIFFAIGTLLLFSITAPVNIAIMYSVPAALKAQAMAVSVGLSHLIGDFPSPFVIGALIDSTGYKVSVVITSAILTVPVVLWAVSGFMAKKKGDSIKEAGLTNSESNLRLTARTSSSLDTTIFEEERSSEIATIQAH